MIFDPTVPRNWSNPGNPGNHLLPRRPFAGGEAGVPPGPPVLGSLLPIPGW